MHQHAVPETIVDLDALVRDEHRLVPWAPPAVIDGEIVTHPPHMSPLAADAAGVYPTALRGGVVTDPAEIERIRARVERAARPWRHRAPTIRTTKEIRMRVSAYDVAIIALSLLLGVVSFVPGWQFAAYIPALAVGLYLIFAEIRDRRARRTAGGAR